MTKLLTPLTQSEAFEATCKRVGVSVRRIDAHGGTCLVQSRRLPLIGMFHLISRGPVAPTPNQARAVLSEARHQMRGLLVVNAPARIPKSGGLKLASGAELALIDVSTPEVMRGRLHQKWRNQLRKSERCDLTVTDQPLNAAQHEWFLSAEAQQQTARGYRSYPAGFLLAYAQVNKGQARLYTAHQDGQPVAGMLVLTHGQMATYQAGVTTPMGRKACAHNLLLWQVMCDLHQRGIDQLDLGRADLSGGLRRFKLGAGARVETLPGSFLVHSWWQRSNNPSPFDRQIA